MRLFVAPLLMALLPQMALAERAEVVAARDAVTACLYFYGMNNVGYEFQWETPARSP